ncbi:MAG: hypothetical protein CM15mV33_080 [uncultured marine virus]|nr:MAG: hypothetical protein CM15mV33_080 [uncultured marine virus]
MMKKKISLITTKKKKLKYGTATLCPSRTDKGKLRRRSLRHHNLRTIAVVSSTGGSETIEATEDKPVARVNIFVNNEDGTYTRGDRRVPVKGLCFERGGNPKIKEAPMDEIKAVSARVKASLKKKLDEHNEKHGDNAAKRTTLRALTPSLKEVLVRTELTLGQFDLQ